MDLIWTIFGFDLGLFICFLNLFKSIWTKFNSKVFLKCHEHYLEYLGIYLRIFGIDLGLFWFNLGLKIVKKGLKGLICKDFEFLGAFLHISLNRNIILGFYRV